MTADLSYLSLIAPCSGPVRYDYLEGKWVYHRDGHHLLVSSARSGVLARSEQRRALGLCAESCQRGACKDI